MAQAASIEELEASVVELTNQVRAMEVRLSATPGGQCTAEFPHPDQLVFMRGPNHYACPCGKYYKKDGAGGLREGF